MLPNWIRLRAHSTAFILSIDLEIINFRIKETYIATWSLLGHRQNIECGCLASTIWSQQSKNFALFNTESIPIDRPNSIVVDLHKLICLNEVFISLLICLILIVPYFLCEVSMLQDIIILFHLHSIHHFCFIIVISLEGGNFPLI